MNLSELKSALKSLANPEKAKTLQRFFKTGKGEYGEGDIFLGIPVPQVRKISKKYLNLTIQEIDSLLESKIHEERLIALLILVEKFKTSRFARSTKKYNANLDGTQESKNRSAKILDENKKNKIEQRRIFDYYLANTKNVNNWDLVDLSAEKIVGEFLNNEDKSILYHLAKSKNIWERRIAIISTFNFIKKRKFGETLAVSEILLKDEQDLIHKAVGWMLREVGKRDKNVLELFLKTHYKEMPRTMLRYAIEKFPEEKRKAYLKGEI